VRARVNLGNLTPDDVQVQLFHGVVDSLGEIPVPLTAVMNADGRTDNGTWTYAGTIRCRSSGQHGFAVRVLPRHKDLGNPFQPGLVVWG
jgi:starch phosphorylase